MRNHPWLRDLMLVNPMPVQLTREAFVARYFPRYVEAYRPPTGIRLTKSGDRVGRCIMSTPGSTKAQITKRDNRIDEAFARYVADHDSLVAMNAESTARNTTPPAESV